MSTSAFDASNASRHHFLTILLIVAPLGATLVPIIGTLIFFAPSESRKRPVFLLNILACILGICQAIFFVSLNSFVLLHPDEYVSHTTLIAAIAVLLAPPILVDSILLFRLLAFYPIQLTPHKTLIAILTPTSLVKAARLACLIAFIVTYPISRLDAPGYVAVQGLVWGRGHWIIAVFALQALDNTYVSSMFLYKLYRFGYTTQKAVGGSRGDIFSRVPAVFIIALGNYVVPVTIDILMIILMVLLPDWTGGIYILFIANFVTIFGIVFATVWTTNQNWIIRRMVEAGVDMHTLHTTHTIPRTSFFPRDELCNRLWVLQTTAHLHFQSLGRSDQRRNDSLECFLHSLNQLLGTAFRKKCASAKTRDVRDQLSVLPSRVRASWDVCQFTWTVGAVVAPVL